MVNSVKNHQDHEGKTWCSSSSFFSMSLTASCLSWISAIVSNICHPLTNTMCSKLFLWALHGHCLFLISQACQLKLGCVSLTQCTLPTIMLYSHDKNSVCLQKQDEHTCNTHSNVTQHSYGKVQTWPRPCSWIALWKICSLSPVSMSCSITWEVAMSRAITMYFHSCGGAKINS